MNAEEMLAAITRPEVQGETEIVVRLQIGNDVVQFDVRDVVRVIDTRTKATLEIRLWDDAQETIRQAISDARHEAQVEERRRFEKEGYDERD